MKFVSKNGKTYVRHWFKWYYLDAFLVWRLDFKSADETVKLERIESDE